MPKIFTQNQKFKIVEYGVQGEQVVSIAKITNDLYQALRKMVKAA